METIHEWLTDSTNGLNAQLAILRAKYSPALTSTSPGELPDVATFQKFIHATSSGRSLSAPYISMVLTAITPEADSPNSRFYDYTVQLSLLVLDRDIDGGEEELAQAAWRYYDGLKAAHDLRSGTVRGATLFNGGTAATGRVIWSSLGNATLVQDTDVESGNFGIRSILIVRIAEDY